MKKANKIHKDYDDGMLPEYDFTGKKGVRGKYYLARQQGYTIRIHNEDGTVSEQRFGPTITLDPEVGTYFPDSESVNKALRLLISLIPYKQIGEKKAKYSIGKKSRKRPPAKK